jgi:peptide/nickel transport system substrate-binding protein
MSLNELLEKQMNKMNISFLKRFLLILLILVVLPNSFLAATEPIIVSAGIAADPPTLDPAQSWEDASTLFCYNIYETLVCNNLNTGKIEPSLAVTWKVNEDGKEWIFKLREGVTFQDGSSFNADAVVFSFARQLHKDFKYRYYDFTLFREIFPALKDVKKIDDYHVSFILTEAFYPFLNSLTSTNAAIVSPQAVKTYGKDFPAHPVGTGAFQLKSWQKGKRVVLEKFNGYWGDKPFIDEFHAEIVANAQTAHRLFQQQKLDIIFLFSISKTMGLKLLNWVKVHHSTLPSVNYITFNFRNKFLQKKNIRKALFLLWDSRYLKYVFQEYILPSGSFISPRMLGYEKETVTSYFSMEKARQLLKKANLSKQLQLTLLMHEGSDLNSQIMALYASNMKKAGIQLKIFALSPKDYAKRVATGDYDMALAAWIVDFPDTHSLIFPMFSTDLEADGLANMSSYGGRDRLLSKIEAATGEPDNAKRGDIYSQINRMIFDEVLCIPISHSTKDFLYNKNRLTNIQVGSTGNFSLRGIKRR